MRTGELIRKYRKMQGLTQSELAEKCGLTGSAIRNYDLGNGRLGRMPGKKEPLGASRCARIAFSMFLRQQRARP